MGRASVGEGKGQLGNPTQNKIKESRNSFLLLYFFILTVLVPAVQCIHIIVVEFVIIKKNKQIGAKIMPLLMVPYIGDIR